MSHGTLSATFCKLCNFLGREGCLGCLTGTLIHETPTQQYQAMAVLVVTAMVARRCKQDLLMTMITA
jgi:hypothetical protein